MVRAALFTSLCIGLTLGTIRYAAPEPGLVFGARAADAPIPSTPLERLYGLLYALANLGTFPVFDDYWRTYPEIEPPDIGTAGFSDTEMGQSLSDLRRRTVGGGQDIPSGELGFMDALRHEMERKPSDRPEAGSAPLLPSDRPLPMIE